MMSAETAPVVQVENLRKSYDAIKALRGISFDLQSVMQRERGSLRRYRLAPIGPGTIVGSSLLANYLRQLPTVALLVLCATALFHMPLQISLLTLFLLVTIGSFAFAGHGLTIASIANTMQEAQIYNNVVWFTLLFLSASPFLSSFFPGGFSPSRHFCLPPIWSARFKPSWWAENPGGANGWNCSSS
jgi:hypothetical protein